MIAITANLLANLLVMIVHVGKAEEAAVVSTSAMCIVINFAPSIVMITNTAHLPSELAVVINLVVAQS